MGNRVSHSQIIQIAAAILSIEFASGCGTTAPKSTPPVEIHQSGLTFYPGHFAGMGSLAIIAGSEKDTTTGGRLFVLSSPKGSAATSVHQLTSIRHAETAKFSADGKFIAYETHDQDEYHWWMTDIAGLHPIQLPDTMADPIWIPGTSNLLTSDGASIETILPNGTKVKHAVQFPKGGEVRFLLFNRQGNELAVDYAINPADVNHDYSIIEVYPFINGTIAGNGRQIYQSLTGDGAVSASFDYKGKTIYFWNDPKFGELDDGEPLYGLNPSNGKLFTVGDTLPSPRSIQFAPHHHTIVWQSDDRFLFTQSKRIVAWKNGQWIALDLKPNDVQILPTLSGDGSLVAYIEGAALNFDSATDAQIAAWSKSGPELKLYSFQTEKSITLTRAGRGVMTPYFTSDSSKIIYLNGDTISWLFANGKSNPVPIAAARQSGAAEGTIGVNEFTIADYRG